ncbi:DUF6221 family protein [Streptomyces sp. OUCMDZ-3434]|uniref:DUF6221 family protein n=1 Tax=Streptomyces sp. OUCMDZ-3434 TaxID=1535304 RepID=UPI001E555C60|nr:DUF6221 family protein [Streptomyces sp. OUCMDZ-3434]
MTAGLIAFLRARLDEDEVVARAVGWDEVDAVDYLWGTRHLLLKRADESKAGAEMDASLAAHIARHDPARVLAEVEAKRRIVRAHEKWCEGRCEAKYPEGGFDAAHYWSVKSLAAAYADHPDYREEWRP